MQAEPTDALTALVAAATSVTPVSGLTHAFYRYPARFSPEFARAAIEAFTLPGDTVLDPFMGGGTTIVEAMALGRRGLGNDISPLAVFLTEAKTTLLDADDLRALRAWRLALNRMDLRRSRAIASDQDPATDWSPYRKHLPFVMRRVIRVALSSVTPLPQRAKVIARCCLLRTAQWAVDYRGTSPTSGQFLMKHADFLEEMLESAVAFRREVGAHFPRRRARGVRRLICSPAADLTDEALPASWKRPSLVVTSPPYPGIHILYHRWQVRGRLETPAPFWIAGCVDGHGASHYTFVDRRRRLSEYLRRLIESFTRINRLLRPGATIVQLVAFPNRAVDLPEYLVALESTGLMRVAVAATDEGVVLRRVPNRRWYADLHGGTGGSTEVMLVHRKGSLREGSHAGKVDRGAS